MKRLKQKLLGMEPNTTTYAEMYNGSMIVADPSHPTMEPYVDYSSVYYNGDVGFEITTTHKPAQDKPTVTVIIPCDCLGIGDYIPAAADFCLRAEGFTSYPAGRGSERLAVSDMGFILMGDERVDVRGLHDIVSPRQLTAIGFMLRFLAVTNRDAVIDLRARVDELYARVEREGLDCLYTSYFTTCERFLDLPRRQELLAVIHRLRGVGYLR